LEIVNSLPRDYKQIFQGKLRSTVTCPRGHEHCISESFLNVSLDVPFTGRRQNSILLKSLLKNFINKNEKIFGYKCDNCKNKICTVLRKYSFEKLPEVLVFHFKLFDSMARKKNAKIGFEEIMRIGNEEYEVISVVEHIGRGIHFGHYVSYARRSDGVWVRLNDSQVGTVSKSEVMNRMKPYMVLYRKRRKHVVVKKKVSRGGVIEKIENKLVEGLVDRGIEVNGDMSIGDINADIEEIFNSATKTEKKNNENVIIEEEEEEIKPIEIEEPQSNQLKKLNDVVKTNEYKDYMDNFDKLNNKILSEKENTKTEIFTYNGKTFETRKLITEETKTLKKPFKIVYKLSKKFKRLSKMRNLLKNSSFFNLKKTKNKFNQIIKPELQQYISKVELENKKDLYSVKERKNSDDLEYDKGKTKKIRKKNKRKKRKRKMNFHKVYMKKNLKAN
jgi:hypothetical protein